jgi:putative nucleotidyltransferase with HDIG domain
MVGGYLRDALLARVKPAGSHHDLDFMVMPGGAIEFARSAAQRLAGHFVLLDQENDTARVVTGSGDCLDFAGCVGGSLESDLKRRDFTINALAWDSDRGSELIDLSEGIRDIKNKVVRVISEQSFLDDPLRLLRAHRFAALLDFQIEETTRSLIGRHSASLSRVASERVSTELFFIFECEKAADQIMAMACNGLLETIFPELAATREVTPNAFHHLGLFEHSLETLVQAELAFRQMPAWVQTAMARPLSSGVSRLSATKLAALIHDIGKPGTWIITEEGKHTFIGHDKLGAEMCEPLARRLKWSKSTERFIQKLVRWHLRPGHLFSQGVPTEKAKLRFYKVIGEELPELVVLALADFRSTCGPGLQGARAVAEENLFELLGNFCVYEVVKKKDTRFLDGNQLMKLLGIGPGPVVGEILEDILEAQLLGELKSPGDAASMARKLYREKYCR